MVENVSKIEETLHYKDDTILEGGVLGASSEAGTPDPISNSAVKRFSADGTPLARGRVGQCREHPLSKTPPAPTPVGAGFLCYTKSIHPYL